ncbi:pseudouridine-5'-phosphate glycosidase [soil metagenome]
MPYPENLETALKIEKTIRDNGALPATIAILNGVVKVGLSPVELEILANTRSESSEILKASRRDIAYVVSEKLNAATTVSGTMICAAMAQIRFFATGGIGGVHRGANESFDISADLTELARTEVAVISAGVKSILDIRATLEFLETRGVPVVGYKTSEFPAFYTRESGYKVDRKFDSASGIASFLRTHWDLGLHTGVLIANPIPEKFSYNKTEIDSAIESALKLAEEKKVKGKEITPFLLNEIKNITGGKSLAANRELVFNNAKAASEMASEYSKLN